jgi:hypothetical protein
MDLHQEWALEMELDLDESCAPDCHVFIAEVARFATGEVHCGRWAYDPRGIWRCLESFSIPLDQELRDTYQRHYYRLTGLNVKLPSPSVSASPTLD